MTSAACPAFRRPLSKIEHDKLSPTYANLVRLARGLQVSTYELFGDGRENAIDWIRHGIMRIDEGNLVITPNYSHFYLHAQLPKRAMTPILVDIHVHSLEEFGPMVSHPGQEFTYVLNGVVELHAKDRPISRLMPGDSIYFDSTVPHAYLVAGRSPARVLTVCIDLDPIEVAQLQPGHNVHANS